MTQGIRLKDRLIFVIASSFFSAFAKEEKREKQKVKKAKDRKVGNIETILFWNQLETSSKYLKKNKILWGSTPQNFFLKLNRTLQKLFGISP